MKRLLAILAVLLLVGTASATHRGGFFGHRVAFVTNTHVFSAFHYVPTVATFGYAGSYGGYAAPVASDPALLAEVRRLLYGGASYAEAAPAVVRTVRVQADGYGACSVPATALSYNAGVGLVRVVHAGRVAFVHPRHLPARRAFRLFR